MKKSTKIRTGRHCVFQLNVHLVFVTKYRKNVFNDENKKYLKKLFSEICDSFESELLEFNGSSEHVHLLVSYPPKIAISVLVNSLKGVSSRMLKKKYPNLKTSYFKGALWSPSYFAGSCGETSLSEIQKYIQYQKEAE